MSDRDDLGHAWHTTPSGYRKQRPATFQDGAPRCCYVFVELPLRT